MAKRIRISRPRYDSPSKQKQRVGEKLMALLADVYDGSVPDPDDELLGQLLNGLYPSKLSTSEILRYLRLKIKTCDQACISFFGIATWWRTRRTQQCAELLDILVERSDELSEEIRKNPTDTRNPIYHLPSNLLVRFLNTAQEEITLRAALSLVGGRSMESS